MAHNTQITGRVSELTAEKALLSRGWEVSRPILDEKYDLLVHEPGRPSSEFFRAQVKTIRRREDRNNEMVVYATNGKGVAYTSEDIDFLVGVEGEDTYLIPCSDLKEYWCTDADVLRKGWRKLGAS